MLEDAKNWAGLIALLFSIGGIAYSFLTAGSKSNSEELKAVSTKLIELDRRVQAAESELNHMPAKDDVVELKVSMAELKGTVNSLIEGLSGVSRTVRRVEDYLMKEGK